MPSKPGDEFLIVNPEDLASWGYNLADLKGLAAQLNREPYVSRFAPPGAAIIGQVPDLRVRDDEISFHCNEHGRQSLAAEQVMRDLRYSALIRPPINPWRILRDL
jgi:hypothetical protein